MRRESRSAQIFADHMPLTVLERRNGNFIFEVSFDDYHVNAAGGVHGGMILSALDIAIAGGGSAAVNDGIGSYGITLTLNANFIAPAPPARLRCEGRTVGGGKSTKFVEARLLGDDGTLYATASGAVRVIPMAESPEVQG